MSNSLKVPCLVLAGGQSRRMGGGDKFLKRLGSKTILDHVLDTIEPQVSDILINSNSDLEGMRYPVRKDGLSGHLGPLAGILTGLQYFSHQEQKASHMLSVPADAPFIPEDLVERLLARMSSSPHSIVMAYSMDRIHPVVALWPFALKDELERAIKEEGLRKILVFAERYSLNSVRWSEEEGDPFYNINRPEDFDYAEKMLPGKRG
ncbi:MAG: molybdenum cofactor guanylyltransferase MobA [Sneathiellales bacterium]|nr:molybdenum cofactor guanylyltransferase MobA [Sneathiellales bacterium]